MNRRSFMRAVAATAATGAVTRALPASADQPTQAPKGPGGPVLVSSANGLPHLGRAMELLKGGADPLDAVLAVVTAVESDPKDQSVGYGGIPNEEGVVELDASVMHGPTARAGAVAALRNIKNPSLVARKVMERTDHVLLVGDGALKFARAHGFKEEDLLTDESREAWLTWKERLSDEDDWIPPEESETGGGQSRGRPAPAAATSLPDVEFSHGTSSPPSGLRASPGLGPAAAFAARPRLTPFTYGTINCNALDARGNLAGATTTSGLSYKIPGRVGDSPIIGAGLFVDNDAGAAGSTGRGEAVLQVCGAHLVVELMRNGRDPQAACLEALQRIADQTKVRRLLDAAGRPNFDVKFYALAKDGRHAGASMWTGGKFAVCDAAGSRLVECAGLYKR